MKILGVTIIYDENETIHFRNQLKESGSKKNLDKLRVYELTDEFDKFRKYRCAFGSWDILKIHIHKVFSYWCYRFWKYSNQ
ncbi:MAG: hypothetical protein FWD40_11955 [Treponema sp.]|nr:hypothetical protein [Treponema sp.]